MDRTIGKSQKRNYDGERLMKILKSYKRMMAEFINEADVDDEKIIKYKTKDGEPGEMKAGSAKTMPKDHPAKISYDKMQGDGDDSEKDSAGKLGTADFDREGEDVDDTYLDADDDDDYETAEEKSEKENSQIGKDLNAMEGDLNGLGIDFLDSAIDDGMYAVLADPESEGDPEKEMAVNAFPDGKGVGYAVNIGSGHKMIYFDNKEKMLDAAKKLVNDDRIRKSMDKDGKEDLADLGDYAESLLKGKEDKPDGKIDTDDDVKIPDNVDDITDMLKKDSDIVDKMGDDVFWDGRDLVSSKFNNNIIASIDDDMTLGDVKKQIMDFEGGSDKNETKVINGVKYKPIKESKKHILKENYDRIFRSRK